MAPVIEFETANTDRGFKHSQAAGRDGKESTITLLLRSQNHLLGDESLTVFSS
jgi:hypothetical protein